MRIYISQALSALGDEVNELTAQKTLCRQWIRKIESYKLDGLDGASKEALEKRIQRQSAIVVTHHDLYRSLISADKSHIKLIQGLPTTSTGELDTAIATRDRDAAIGEIARLKKQRDSAIAQAKQTNSQLQAALLRYLYRYLSKGTRDAGKHFGASAHRR